MRNLHARSQPLSAAAIREQRLLPCHPCGGRDPDCWAAHPAHDERIPVSSDLVITRREPSEILCLSPTECVMFTRSRGWGIGELRPGQTPRFRNEHAAVQNQIPVTCEIFFIRVGAMGYKFKWHLKSAFFRKNHAGSPFSGGASHLAAGREARHPMGVAPIVQRDLSGWPDARWTPTTRHENPAGRCPQFCAFHFGL